MEILQEIKKRRSYRSFSEKQINDSELNLIFEAARIAPSSSNAQAWKYYFAKKGSRGFERILETLSEGNKIWAKNASVLIGCCAAKTYSNGKEYIHAWHDLGLSNSQLIIQATHLGYFGHIMGGFSAERAAEALKIRGNYDIVCIIALGEKGDGSDLNENHKERENQERERKSIGEVAIEIS